MVNGRDLVFLCLSESGLLDSRQKSLKKKALKEELKVLGPNFSSASCLLQASQEAWATSPNLFPLLLNGMLMSAALTLQSNFECQMKC